MVNQARRHANLTAWLDAHSAILLMLLLSAALCLGIVKLWISPPSLEWDLQNRWWQIALSVARGEGYVACKTIYFPFCGPGNQVTAMREPLPVLLFALLAKFSNESLLGAAFAEVVINLGIVVAIFVLTRELSNARVGLLAALLWVCYLAPIRLFYAQVSGDLLATFCLTWGLVFFLRACLSRRRREWFVAGVLIGLAVLSRSAVIVVALVLTLSLILWLARARSNRQSWVSRVLLPAALFALGWALVLSPWIARNYVAFGRPVIGSTLGGYYLYRQNYHLPTESYLRFISGGEFTPVLEQMIARRSNLRGTENEADMDAIYREEALHAIFAEPVRYVILSAYRFLMLWFNWGVEEVYGARPSIGDIVINLQHVIFLIVGAVGLALFWRKTWALAVSVVSFSLLYMAVQSHVTYVIPVMPFLVTFAALGCAAIVTPLFTARAGTASNRYALRNQV